MKNDGDDFEEDVSKKEESEEDKTSNDDEGEYQEQDDDFEAEGEEVEESKNDNNDYQEQSEEDEAEPKNGEDDFEEDKSDKGEIDLSSSKKKIASMRSKISLASVQSNSPKRLAAVDSRSREEDPVPDEISKPKESLEIDAAIPELWPTADRKEQIDRLKREVAEKKSSRKKTSPLKPLLVNPKKVKTSYQRKKPQQQPSDDDSVPLCREDQDFVDFVENTNKEVFDLANDIVADIVKEVKTLNRNHEKALKKLIDDHQTEKAELKKTHDEQMKKLRDQLASIESKIDVGQKVTNATYDLIFDSLSSVNKFIKRVYGVPLFKMVITWGENVLANNEAGENDDRAPPETDFLFPETFGDLLSALKLPLGIMHLVAWFLAWADNRIGSYLCRKYGIRTHWLLKVRETLSN